jgi:predicted HAD superfamily phosphohydrolase
MVRFSGRNIEMIPTADRVLREILEVTPAYIVSTSYSPYVKAVCDAMGFPFGNTFCTEVDLDAYRLSAGEKTQLTEIRAQIMELPDFTIPSGASSPGDLSLEDLKTVQVFDEIFWRELPKMEINRIIEEVNPIGGREKARSIEKIAAKEKVDISDIIYFGDSITDVDAFRLLKSSGGLAISFNGNDWAVKEAHFAVTATNAHPIGWLAKLFLAEGPQAFQDLMMNDVTPETAREISAKSSRIRKEVRTETIGSLG